MGRAGAGGGASGGGHRAGGGGGMGGPGGGGGPRNMGGGMGGPGGGPRNMGGGMGGPPPRNGWGGGWYGGPRRRGCCSGFLLIPIIIVIGVIWIFTSLFSGGSYYATAGGASANTSTRTKLTGVASYDTDCVIDELGWIEDVDELESDLKYFFG